MRGTHDSIRKQPAATMTSDKSRNRTQQQMQYVAPDLWGRGLRARMCQFGSSSTVTRGLHQKRLRV